MSSVCVHWLAFFVCVLDLFAYVFVILYYMCMHVVLL